MKVVKYWQKNCVPCKMMDESLQALGLVVDESVEVTKENAKEVTMERRVTKTPTLIKYDYDGTEVDRLSSVGVKKIAKFFGKE